MKKSPMLFLLPFIIFPAMSFAGEMFGTLREGGKAVTKGIKIEVVITDKTYTGETDAYGSYRLFVVEKGKCTLNVYYNKQTPSFEVYSYDKSTRYDMNLETKDGKYLLKRK
jgi:hypothetical protein